MNGLLTQTTYLPDDYETTPPNSTQQSLKEIAQKLAEAVEEHGARSATLSFNSNTEIDILLPKPLLQALLHLTEAMSRNLAVSIVPHTLQLSTQEAADLLGISRPTLVRMLENGKIPFEQHNRHRRIYLADILEYQKRQRRIANEALDDLVADAQMLGLYDIPQEELLEAAREARKGKPESE